MTEVRGGDVGLRIVRDWLERDIRRGMARVLYGARPLEETAEGKP